MDASNSRDTSYNPYNQAGFETKTNAAMKHCLVFDQVISRQEIKFIRSSLSSQIEEYNHAIKIAVDFGNNIIKFDHYHLDIESPLDSEHELIKTVSCLINTSNIILGYLDFLEKKIGLPSGGDPALREAVGAGQLLARLLLETVLRMRGIDVLPEFELGYLEYGVAIRFTGEGLMQHRDMRVAQDDDSSDDTWHKDDTHDVWFRRRWHVDSTFHPLRRIPGTAWHKFFGSLHHSSNKSPLLFRKTPRDYFKVVIPDNAYFVRSETESFYEYYRDLFMRAEMRNLERALSIHFSGKIGEPEVIEVQHGLCVDWDDASEFDEILVDEEKWELINMHMNIPELAGIALYGEDIRFSEIKEEEHTIYELDDD
ncbi:hypothetical protein QBC46DRAFT_338060 [Diplogelasinospora grovesii]|uniref:Uncharacterized protein n=1 Tax=Diplogelasinospora grovesii TaxID=303347 RepID=A0AAN6S8T3_9PEZI|nr:hypothetical protein QBC46DRAFT_338060 [Diplogelasinospora grovesii]